MFDRFGDVPTAVLHDDPGLSTIADGGRVGLLAWDGARVDLSSHDLSNDGAQIFDDCESG